VNLNLNDTKNPNFPINSNLDTNNNINNDNNKINNNNNNNNNKTTQNVFNNVNSFRDISFVLPLELEVTQQVGIYSPVEIIDFQSVSIRENYFYNDSIFPATMTSNDFENSLISPFINDTINENLKKVFNLYLTNNGPTALEIKVIIKFVFYSK